MEFQKFDPYTFIGLTSEEEMVVLVDPFERANLMMGYEGNFNQIHVSPYFNNVVFAVTSVSQFSED